jgi:hypothetical protein
MKGEMADGKRKTERRGRRFTIHDSRFTLHAQEQKNGKRGARTPVAGQISEVGGLRSPPEARRLASVVSDVGASMGIIVTRGKGSGPLAPGIEQKGFGSDLDWLPGAAA